MPVLDYDGGQAEITDEGFLVDTDSWNDNIAKAIAKNEGIGDLTGDQMEVIRFMRGYYNSYKSFPILNNICRNVHQAKECVSEEFIDPLTAWKIAGLPKPEEEVLAYLAPAREIT